VFRVFPPLIAAAGLCASSAFGLSYTVTNTNDSGPGSLRQAILDANDHTNADANTPDTIGFAIAGSGVQTIHLTSAPLPPITDPVVIDGYTQPGSSVNTLAVGDNAVVLIKIRGDAPNGNSDILDLEASNCTVRGLSVGSLFIGSSSIHLIGNRIIGNLIGQDVVVAVGIRIFSKETGNYIGDIGEGNRNLIAGETAGIQIDAAADNNTIQNNYIGTDQNGMTTGYTQLGVSISASGTLIGGTLVGAGNVIVGLNSALDAGDGATIQGNFIGVDATGTQELGSGDGGVRLGTGSLLGGTMPGARNVILGIVDAAPAGGSVIQGNYLGVTADGNTALGRSSGPGLGPASAIIINSNGNTIGGPTGAARNVIVTGGIEVLRHDNVVQGNYIGLNAAGAAALGKFPSFTQGIWLASADNNTVSGNVVANVDQGIVLYHANNNTLRGNRVGTNAAGTAAIPNNSGLTLATAYAFDETGTVTGNIIGGTQPGDGNVISGNLGDGINFYFDSYGAPGPANNLIQGNYIGIAADGITPLPNFGNGIAIDSGDNNVIGGTQSGVGNIIAYNGSVSSDSKTSGVKITRGIGNSILGNAIYRNSRLGIDLVSTVGNESNENSVGVTPNDPGDGDTGPNNLQNYPELKSVVISGASAQIAGTLNSNAGTTFRLEFFSNRIADPSGFGQGQSFLGFTNVTTDMSGNASFNVAFPSSDDRVTISATATDPNGNTSEFSAAFGTRLRNISTRGLVLSGDQALIGGFIISGADPKKVIIRGLGPSLSAYGVPGALQDPTLELNGRFGTISNDNWKDTQRAEIEATGIPPSNDLESAIVASLKPGAYTAILRGKNNTTGVGLVEIFDVTEPVANELVNVSTRGFVGADDNVLIGGVIIGPNGSGTAEVVLRALGPSLASFGVQGALQDPTLELHNENGAVIQSNDNWQQAPNTNEIPNGFAPTDARESVIVTTLEPGSYTAIVRGKDNSTGIGLIEVYKLP
jgi:parallel beta-helix repeat protein